MSESFEYLERRVQSQRQWHNDRAVRNKRCFYCVEVVTLLAGAAIPIVILCVGDDLYRARLFPTILGGIVVLATAVGKLFKFQENWLQYRTLVEALGREEELYITQAGEYAEGDAARRNRLFVERIENLLTTSTSQFVSTHRAARNTDGRGANANLKPSIPADPNPTNKQKL